VVAASWQLIQAADVTGRSTSHDGAPHLTLTARPARLPEACLDHRRRRHDGRRDGCPRFDIDVRNVTNTTYTDFLGRYKRFFYGQGVNVILKVATTGW
jgi:hypothetical protein